MKIVSFPLALLVVIPHAFAADEGLRYDANKNQCVNAQGQVGYDSGNLPMECVDFRGVGIGGIPLEGARILGMNISRTLKSPVDDQDTVNIYAADARGLTAIDWSFTNGNFTAANLEDADFSGTSFRSRGRRITSFEKADLRYARFRHSLLTDANLKDEVSATML